MHVTASAATLKAKVHCGGADSAPPQCTLALSVAAFSGRRAWRLLTSRRHPLTRVSQEDDEGGDVATWHTFAIGGWARGLEGVDRGLAVRRLDQQGRRVRG